MTSLARVTVLASWWAAFVWPRGLNKVDLKISAWEKSIALSRELRNWYGHDPEKWPEFRKRYRKELKEAPRKEVLDRLIALARQGTLTLVFGALDADHSKAAVIAEEIRANLKDR